MVNRYFAGKTSNSVFRLLAPVFFLFLSLPSHAQQLVWFEDFGINSTGSCDRGRLANGSVTANGAWTVVDLGPQDPFANQWYMSSTEVGVPTGSCAGTGCASGNPAFVDRTLHVGSVLGAPNAVLCPSLDCGAVYDPGDAFNSVATDRRVESPTINCSLRSNLVLAFKYVEQGEANGNDNAVVDYFDGTVWTTIFDTPQTPLDGTCGNGSARWTYQAVPLPISANNNPNVKIGFQWRNDNGLSGVANPSFAVDSVVVVALAAPTASFTANDTDICVGQCINFTADTSLLISSYSWSFIGATTGSSSVYNPTSICYPNPGTYSVQLIVSGISGTDTLIKTNYITVNPCTPPIADFLASDTNICERDCIVFTDLSVGATGWKWFFQGGTPAFDTTSGPNPPQVCFSAPGAYSVSLIVSNAYGSDTLTKIGYIVANNCPLPIANFTDVPTRFCPQHCVSFRGTDTLGTNAWQWYFPGATPDTASGRNPTVCYTHEGLYDVQLIASNMYGSDTILKFSEVNVQFVPNAAVNQDTTMQFGSSYQLIASGGLTYQWSPSLGLDSIYSPTPIATPALTTTYVVIITDTNGCFVDRQVTVTVLHDNKIFVPNTFSPNGDGYNDYLFVRGNNLYGIRFTIFDRWGEKVFETTDPLKGWDGTYKGKNLDPAVFTYIVTINFDDGKSNTETGSVTLVR